MLNIRFFTLLGMILIAAFSRIIPHPSNVTPIAAMALFGGAYFSDKKLAFAIPLLSLILSDLVIGFHSQMLSVYFCFIVTVMIGLKLNSTRKGALTILSATLASSVLFFIVTNFGVWLMDGLYPRTFQGLWACYIAAIPFLRNSFLGDLFYVTVLFGGFALAQMGFPALEVNARSVAKHS